MGSLRQQSFLKGQSNVVENSEEVPIDEIFRQIATNDPHRVAISYEDENDEERTFSYKQLDELTNRLARVLLRYRESRSDGDALVAVSMRPTERLPAVLLAILKAGMAYLPLDPEFPVSRVRHILREAKPLVVVTEQGADASVYEETRTTTYLRLFEEASDESKDVPVPEKRSPELPAIVLYTSGSTGVPKGVRLPHASLLNRLEWQWRVLPYSTAEERCVFKTALTFVDSAPEIWGPLLRGRTVVVVPKHVTRDPEKFVQVLEKHKIQRLVLVPSLLRSLLMYLDLRKSDDDNVQLLASLKLWICSGESLSVSLAKQFFTRFPEGRHVLANFYGSTEVMGDVTYHLLSHPSQLEGIDKVPIGRPLDNCAIYLVDKDMRLVPQGEIGELVVAGKNLASGYVRGRDSHRFLDNPHAIDPEYSKIYRTGDYARIVNGVVVYEGRTDAQIKVRGHRVDLAEVEKAIAAIPTVDKAVVVCHKPGELSQALVSFLTVKDNAPISGPQIEASLQNSLPDYMIPQVIVLETIPLLTNGKTDRQALLRQYEMRNRTGNEEATVNCDYSGVPEQHLAMAKILFPTVASVIGQNVRATVTVDGNFYELGGNSLNSVYTVTRLKEQGCHIGITDFITAKDMGVVLSRMRINSNSNEDEDEDEDDDAVRYVVEELNESHKADVVEMITDSFYRKADLERWLMPHIARDDYRELMEKLWGPLLEKGLSFVIGSPDHRGSDGRILGVGLNFDARDEPEITVTSKLTIVFDFLEYLEAPIRDGRLPSGKGQILHSFMMATNAELSSAENVIVMREMERHCLEMARKKSFTGIFTTNTSPLTQQLGTDVYGYEVLLDYRVNEYVAPDGTRPFAKAPDDQRAICSWKIIHQQ